MSAARRDRTRRVGRWLLGVVLLSVASCADHIVEPTDTGCCEVAGVDLVVDSIRVLWPADQQVDAVTGMYVAAATDTLTVRYVVRNRGDEPAPAARLELCSGWRGCSGPWLDGMIDTLAIPALEPGERAVGTGRVPFPLAELFVDTVDVTGELAWGTLVDDPLLQNDRLSSDPFFVAIPQLHGELSAPYAEMRVAVPYAFDLSVTNASRFTASEPTTVTICLADFDICQEFATVSIPGIPPGETYAETVMAAITQEAFGPPFDVMYDRLLYPVGCIGRDDPEFSYLTRCFDTGAGTDVLPNLDDACDAQLVAPDTAVVGTVEQADCRLRTGPSDIWSFDAAAGVTYTATLSAADGPEPLVRLLNNRGEAQASGDGIGTAASFVASAPGRFHVAISGAGNYVLNLTSP